MEGVAVIERCGALQGEWPLNSAHFTSYTGHDGAQVSDRSGGVIVGMTVIIVGVVLMAVWDRIVATHSTV